MKTFDQRYEAWISGHLPADEAEAFERELDEQVITEEEMNACLTDTARLSELFRADILAPALPNEDFLNSSIMRQILEEQSAAEASRRETPAGFMDRVVGILRVLRAPRFALPIGALAMASILGVVLMRPGADPVGGMYAARYDKVSIFDKTQIWAGGLEEHSNVLWVDGLDWIPGDTALN